MIDRKIKMGSVVQIDFVPAAGLPLPVGKILNKVATPMAWSGTYHVDTHGKTADEILAAIERVQKHHIAKSDCLNRFAELVVTPITVGVEVYTWTDATVFERGDDVELYLAVKAADGSRPKCLPLKLSFRACADIPSNSEIAARVQLAIAAEVQSASDHQSILDSVEAMLKGGTP